MPPSGSGPTLNRMPRSLPLAPVLLALTALLPASAGAAGSSAPLPVNGCAPGYVRPDFRALERELTVARVKWAGARVKNYRYDFAQIAAPVLFPTARVTVRLGRVQGAALAPGQQGEIGDQARATVEERFAAVAQTLRLQQGQKCPFVEAEYDAVDGHPVRLYSGSRAANVADGWGEWRVTNFTRL